VGAEAKAKWGPLGRRHADRRELTGKMRVVLRVLQADGRQGPVAREVATPPLTVTPPLTGTANVGRRPRRFAFTPTVELADVATSSS